MDNSRYREQTEMGNSKSRERISVHRDLDWSRVVEPDHNSKDHRGPKCYRKYFHILSVSALVSLASPCMAADVGGVSATANPVATSSGSVTNQAIQVLQGPYITNTYGAGIQCQGPTLNITPFITNSNSFQKPFEDYYKDPVYDVSDVDEDGVIDNPGDILYWKDIRTGQKNSHTLNAGLSATISFPLDRSLQTRCKKAVDTQIALQQQVLANRRLDFEIARLKNCGELAKKGITFHPKSPYFDVCKDVVVRMPGDTLVPHYHPISLKQAVEHESHDSDHAEQADAVKHSPPSGTVLSTKQSSSLSSSR